jgi:hypothetical protein
MRLMAQARRVPCRGSEEGEGQAVGDGTISATKAGKMKPETGRLEKRFGIAIPVRIASLDRPWLEERAMTENVSHFGARILVKSVWRADERVVVESTGGADPCPARVIYCEALKTGGAAIGVRLAKAHDDWMSRSGRIG